ncbi:uncharacterized protein LOC143259463 [Megalopta genalis]|uniref:uncharacterized protein LOC143259463 n=1 Tax=Megalopta genalis TaxID=115081 RepID=UPI003FD1F850
MYPDSISSSDEDEQWLKNYELFSIIRKKLPQEQIMQDIGNCLKNGAEINALNARGKTVLDVARDKNYENLVEFLSALGGKTALDLADGSDTDSYKTQQHSDINRTKSQQQIWQPINMDAADNQKVNLPLPVAAAHGNVKDIASVINLQLPLRETTLTGEQLKLLKQINEEGNTLLSIAAKSGKKDNVDFFIRCGIDINCHNKLKKSAVDLAWENHQFDIVLALLKADSDFPNHFDLTVLNEGNVQKEFKEFVGKRNSLHEQIKENHLEDIKVYTDTISESKLCLNSESQSAMFTAIEKKRFEIFAFLKSAGFMFKNEDEKECINKLSQGEKDTLKTEMISKFPQIDQGHILYLTSKSRSEKPVDKELIEKLYRSLDAIPEVSIILKVIQYIDCLDIIFDFDNDNISNINPTASESTKGTTDYKDGRIYLAAKIEENKLLGTLAQELTHLAIYILYKNDCNPYDNNLENCEKRAFETITANIKDYTKDIVKEMHSNTEDSPLITLARAFTYPEDEQQSELIVSIPHILARYHDEGRRWLLNTNKEIKSLFEYYTDQAKGGIAYRCKEFIENSFLIKPRNSVQVLNEYLGEMNNIIKYEIHFENPIDLDNFLRSNEQVFLLKTENTLLSILSIYESLTIENRNYPIRDCLFLKFNSYMEKGDKINHLYYSAAGKMLCIRYPYDSDKERLSDVLKALNTLLEEKSDRKVVFIIPESKIEEFHEMKRVFTNKCYKEATDRKFTLNDLTEESQQKLLEREVVLQGAKINLKKLIGKWDKNAKQVIDAETLEGLIVNKVIKIGSSPLGTTDLEGAYSDLVDEVNMKTLVDKLLSEESNDIYIISGIPSTVKENKLIEYLVNADIDNSKIPKVNDLKSRIAVLNQDIDTAIDNRIQVAGDQFKKEDFKQICQNNRERKIYWINVKHEGSASKFMLEQIYNPDFYLKGNRFNNEVIIVKNVKEQLASPTLSEIFIIGGKSKQEATRWLQFGDNREQIEFERNYRDHRIKFLNSQHNMLTIFEELVVQNYAKTVHLLKFEQEQLIWCKTYGSLKNLSKYRGKDHRNSKPLIGEDALIIEIKDDKVVIIAGDPGIGKTTTLVKLYELQYVLQSGARESIIKSHWLITINLKDHLDAIRDIDFNVPTEIVQKITDFLLQVDKSISNDFARRLLGMALVKQDFGIPLLITFDGFDEVLDEVNRDKVITLLQRLKDKTKAKFWITTRLHYQQTLESVASTFAIEIDPICDKTTSEFIKKYLKNRLSLIFSREQFQSIFGSSDEMTENTSMQAYAKAFLSKMHEVFKGDVSKLIGRPLQLFLMLEGSTRYFKEWTRDINGQSPDFSYVGNDIWELYENFVDRKYSIYFQKAKVKERLRQEQDKITYDNYHTSLTKYFILKSAPKQSLKTFRDTLLSVGIIRSDGSNIEFIHSTVRDYFAAKVFVNWIAKWKAGNQYVLRKSKKQEYLLKEILVKTDYQVIRIFLNSQLLKEKLTNIHLQEEYYDKDVLFVAAKESNKGICRFVFDNLYNPYKILNVDDNSGMTVLHTAAKYGNLEIVKFLINEKGADFNAKDNEGMTILHTAAGYGNLEIVKFLINEKGADFNAKDNEGMTILHTAVKYGNLEIVKFLINKKGDDFNAKDINRMKILHTAARYGKLEIVKFLINEKRADFDAEDINGMTVLHAAAESVNWEIVKFLINEKGADCNVQDMNGMTILHTAAMYGNLEIVKFLINEKRADFNAEDIAGMTVLRMAAVSGNWEIVKFLINEKGADFTVKGYEGTTILHIAAMYGNLEIVKFLINEKGADFNAKDNNGMTVLHTAAENGNLEIVKLLINEKRADFNAKDNNGMTILHTAARYGNLEIVKFLINEKGADFNAEDIDGMTVLQMAAKFGNWEIVKFLINKKGDDFNAKDINRMKILHTAARYGKLEIVKFLINEKGADFNAKDNNGMTVLHTAAENGNLEIVKFLINEKGADFNAKDNNGRTVLHTAAKYGNLEIVKFLINEKGADFNAKDNKGMTILHTAPGYGNLEIVKFLINEKGADFNAKDNEGMTILHTAVKYGNLEKVKFLINEKGADFNAKHNNGMTILHTAAKYGNLEIVKLLINEKRADFNAKDNNGMTILHTAARSGNLKIVKLLINEKRADFNAENIDGMTVLHVAADFGKWEIVKFLINEKGADFNAKDNNGITILHTAARYGNLEIVKLLINEKRADFNAKDNNGMTILHTAARSDNLEIVKLLINEKRADFNAEDIDGMTVLHVAAEFGNWEIVKFMINEKGANFNDTDNNGNTILHTVARYGNLEIVKFLINEKEANFSFKDINGMTVLHTAAKYGKWEIVKFLINERGADFNAKDNEGMTILHTAARSGNLEIVKLLINEKRADFNAEDINGMTALHIAVKFHHLEVVKYLINKGFSVDARNKFGETVRAAAIRSRNDDIIKCVSVFYAYSHK